MRASLVIALALLSFAPAAFANGYQALGTPCVTGSNACQSGVCGASGLNPENMCLPCTANSCGSNASCQSDGTCLANAAASNQVQTGPAITNSPVQTGPAITNAPGPDVTLINPLKAGTSLESFLNEILAFVIRLGTIVIILMLVFVGYKFVAAQGSDTKITEARQMLLWTVIGALVLLGAQAISLSIQATVKALGG